MSDLLPRSAAIPPLYILIAIVLLVALTAARIPILRRLVGLLTWGGLLVLMVVAFDQRAAFDPYLGKVAAMLALDDQEVVGTEMRIPMARDGHFWARATIAGVERRMLIDSGATLTALAPSTARAARLDTSAGPFPVVLNTANGTVRADTATVGELRLGNIVARDLAVVVLPGFGETDVLGMNFLSRLKSWRVEEGTLILVPHHPQDVAES